MSAPERRGSLILEPENRLPYGGAIVRNACSGSDGRILASPALTRIRESIEECHAGEAQRKLLRRFHLTLRHLIGALFLNLESLLDRYRCRWSTHLSG